MNNLDHQYQKLLRDILRNGKTKEDRTGTGTLSVFGRQIRHDMAEGFPLLTTKKMPFKTITTELLWFLRGDTNIKYLVENGCNIWNGDAYKKYTSFMDNLTQEEFIEKIKTNDEFAKEWGELGPIYGKQWRDWKTFFTQKQGVDQIKNLIEELKTNPDSRRLMVSAWNVGELEHMTLPPCHYGFQVYTREMSLEERNLKWCLSIGKHPVFGQDLDHEDFDAKGFPRRTISLMWNQRSVDTFLGLPFNIASYGLLLMLLAKEVNMLPDELIGNLGDTHLYLNHVKQAEEQVRREPFQLPLLFINDELWNPDQDLLSQIEYVEPHDFLLEDYQSHPTIKAPLSN